MDLQATAPLQLHAIADLLARPIAFHRAFVHLTGSVAAALMLSQALYWQQRCPTDDGRETGWWYKTRDDWSDETGLSRCEQETARKKLSQLGVLHEKRKGNPARLWYRLDVERLAILLAGIQPSSRRKISKLDGENPATSITETTAEITRERVRKRATPAPKEFRITESMQKWATNKGLSTALLEAETDKFIDHHRSKGNTFCDWEAAWRKWMTNTLSWAKSTPATTPKDRYVRA